MEFVSKINQVILKSRSLSVNANIEPGRIVTLF